MVAYFEGKLLLTKRLLSVLLCLVSSMLSHTAYAGDDGSSSYVLATGKDAVKRLAVSESVYGEQTKILLHKFALPSDSGLKILIMACGTGEQLSWASEFVGEKGHVTCADISAAQLDVAKQKAGHLKNVSFVLADILDHHDITTLHQQGLFDLVTSRFLLVHLSDPKMAIKNMYSLVKKGGYVLYEEHDISWINSYPHSEAISKAKEILYKLAEYKKVDFSYGAKLFSVVYDLGYKNAKMALHVPAFNAGIEKHLFDMSLLEGKKAYINAEIMTDSAMNVLIKNVKEFADHNNTWISSGGFFQVYVQAE